MQNNISMYDLGYLFGVYSKYGYISKTINIKNQKEKLTVIFMIDNYDTIIKIKDIIIDYFTFMPSIKKFESCYKLSIKDYSLVELLYPFNSLGNRTFPVKYTYKNLEYIEGLIEGSGIKLNSCNGNVDYEVLRDQISSCQVF